MKTTDGKQTLALVLVFGLLLFGVLLSYQSFSFSQGPNNRNVTIDTRLNITNALPEILQVRIEDNAANVTLAAGTNISLECNVTVRDYNGGSTINNVSAKFYDNSQASYVSPEDHNTMYNDSSCHAIGTPSTYERNFSCLFNVTYYANHGEWTCNVTAWDDFPFTPPTVRYQWGANTTNIDGLLALNVTPLIDYGDLAIGDTSTVQQANVTNLGNLNISVSVEGYGHTRFDGLSFNCTVGNISVRFQAYNITDYGAATARYENLSASLTVIPGLNISQNLNDTGISDNTTYWITYVPPNPFGTCNGSIIFQAENS